VESSTSAEYPDLRSRRRGGDYQSQCATPFRRHLEEEGEVAADKAEAGTILNPNSETTLFGSSVTSSKDTLTFVCVRNNDTETSHCFASASSVSSEKKGFR
jgi:hypothetical protein